MRANSLPCVALVVAGTLFFCFVDKNGGVPAGELVFLGDVVHAGLVIGIKEQRRPHPACRAAHGPRTGR